jgi:hypothetical protein
VQEKRPLSKKLMKSPLGALLAEAAGSLSVFGDPSSVGERLRGIAKLGPKVLVGLPIKESHDQVSAFSRCLGALRAEDSLHSSAKKILSMPFG